MPMSEANRQLWARRGMRVECKEEESPFEMSVCNAAHRLHRTHVAWSRTAINDIPQGCYQCHVFARIVLTEDARL